MTKDCRPKAVLVVVDTSFFCYLISHLTPSSICTNAAPTASKICSLRVLVGVV
ncbi:hypothetical protein BDA96_09G251400 [Sorghum bicolor]|uniref:Uncharacterized protein n=1 Tax=Sorghum bicolor TaxID=4558 RepID=A0A921QCI9_SORBI|nr:hypothetical protein BDA96_09G251400 [Sorghum bicolor]